MIGILAFHRITESEPHDRFSVSLAEFGRILDVIDAYTHDFDLHDLDACHDSLTASIILSFDDGTIDHYEVIAPYLEARRRKGLFFIITDNIGKSGYLSRSNIVEMHAAGHEIGAHGQTHCLLPSLSRRDLIREIESSVKRLEDILGKQISWFAPPKGCYNTAVAETAEKIGVQFFRTMNFGWNCAAEEKTFHVLNAFPISRYFLSPQLQKSIERTYYYNIYSFAYGAKNFVKHHAPDLYMRVRRMIGR